MIRRAARHYAYREALRQLLAAERRRTAQYDKTAKRDQTAERDKSDSATTRRAG